ncbi:MAG: MurR/RpiR family transcriptional regulator [Oscillospiraceae bacterium]|nr:MurR/RpiR family transcriptional regulator [Oscillospiraceae bacterium]
MSTQQHNIIERIHAAYYQLPAAEKKVADYVLAQRDQIQFMSITQLADECGVADATISRFCRSLKLKGFNAFKLELAQHTAPTRVIHAEHQDTATLAGRSQEVGRLAHEAVEQTVQLMQPHQVEKAVELIEKAQRIMCIGSGSSMILAQECANMFSTVTGKFFSVADTHTQISTAATMGKDDIIFLFSYSGATTSGIEMLELARNRGIKTVLVTRFRKSPAAKLADVVLCCGSNEGPYQFGSVPAKIAQLVVIDFLFQEYYYRNQEACDATRFQIGAVLAEIHV